MVTGNRIELRHSSDFWELSQIVVDMIEQSSDQLEYTFILLKPQKYLSLGTIVDLSMLKNSKKIFPIDRVYQLKPDNISFMKKATNNVMVIC